MKETKEGCLYRQPSFSILNQLLYQCDIKLYQIDELLNALFHFTVGKTNHPFQAKLLDTKRRHCRTINHTPFHSIKRNIVDTGEIADESSGESITGTGWIKNIF